MEERLDDAINVLRNHAEPQLGLGQLPPSLGGPQMPLGYVPPQTEAAFPDPIKVERPAHNSSKFTYRFHRFQKLICVVFAEKRKEPPDSDTKPSSSVEGVVPVNSTSAPANTKGTKRARR